MKTKVRKHTVDAAKPRTGTLRSLFKSLSHGSVGQIWDEAVCGTRTSWSSGDEFSASSITLMISANEESIIYLGGSTS